MKKDIANMSVNEMLADIVRMLENEECRAVHEFFYSFIISVFNDPDKINTVRSFRTSTGWEVCHE